MTNKEAIDILERAKMYFVADEIRIACEMAIEALTPKEPKTMYGKIKSMSIEEMIDFLVDMIGVDLSLFTKEQIKSIKDSYRKWLESEVEE